MATNDDMGEVNAQERTQVIAGAEQPTANHNIRMAGGEHLRSRDMAQQLDVKVSLHIGKIDGRHLMSD